MTIQDMSTIQAQVAVNEVDVSRVAVGQNVNLGFDAINGLTTTGVVQHIAATGSTSQGVVTNPTTIT